MTRIVASQLAPTIADVRANQEMSLTTVLSSMAAGARLVVMPELVVSGNMFVSAEEARPVAITRHHPVFGAWAEGLAGVDGVVVEGFVEIHNGLVYNSIAVVDGSGVVEVYRKDHLLDREKLIFTPGSAEPPVVDTCVGRLGLLISYDLEFPEMTRSMALRGPELIVAPANWTLEARPAGEHPPEVIIAMAAARTNQVGVVCCDRSGPSGATHGSRDLHHRRSRLDRRASGAQNGEAVADLDLHRSCAGAVTELLSSFGDRRPELYGAVTVDRAVDGAIATT